MTGPVAEDFWPDLHALIHWQLEREADLERNPPTRMLGLYGLAGRICISCGATCDYFGRLPCGH